MQMDVAVLILNRRAFIAATGVVHSFEPVPMHAENADAQAVASAINEPVGTIDRHGSPHHRRAGGYGRPGSRKSRGVNASTRMREKPSEALSQARVDFVQCRPARAKVLLSQGVEGHV